MSETPPSRRLLRTEGSVGGLTLVALSSSSSSSFFHFYFTEEKEIIMAIVYFLRPHFVFCLVHFTEASASCTITVLFSTRDFNCRFCCCCCWCIRELDRTPHSQLELFCRCSPPPRFPLCLSQTHARTHAVSSSSSYTFDSFQFFHVFLFFFLKINSLLFCIFCFCRDWKGARKSIPD